jgi:hypothetical protein
MPLTTHHDSASSTRPGRLRVLAGAVVALLVVAAIGVAPAAATTSSGVVAAANNSTTSTNISDVAGYYDNESAVVANESWMDGREEWSFDNGTNYLTRLSTFLVGSGHTAQGGAGSAGALITGLAVFGMFAGLLVGSGVGAVAGMVLAVSTTVGVIRIGLAPAWLYAVLLFLLGGLATTAFVRSQR